MKTKRRCLSLHEICREKFISEDFADRVSDFIPMSQPDSALTRTKKLAKASRNPLYHILKVIEVVKISDKM